MNTTPIATIRPSANNAENRGRRPEQRLLVATQCYPPDIGGIEALVEGLVKTIASTGTRVLVMADRRGRSLGDETPKTDGVEVRRFGGWKPIRRRMKARAIDGLMRGGGISGVVCESWKSLALIRKPPATTICLAHGMEFPLDAGLHRRTRLISAFAKATIVVANSRFTADVARSWVPGQVPIHVVAPPISRPDKVDPVVLAKLAERCAGSGPLIATLCRLEPHKGVDQLIRAIGILKGRVNHLHLAIGGDGPDLERLIGLASHVGVTNHVRFLGRLSEPEKYALFDLADVFAMPSRRVGNAVEGFGIVYLEAGWFGTPSIAGRDGGASDAVRDEHTGLHCDGSSIESVVNILERLLVDHALRRRLGSAAAAHARANTWDERIGDYSRLLRGDWQLGDGIGRTTPFNAS